MAKNWKGKLQEFGQQRGWQLPKYITSRVDGEDHRPVFRTELKFYGCVFKETGGSKKESEQNAAKRMFEYMDSAFGASYLSSNEISDPEYDSEEQELKREDVDQQDVESITHVMMIDGENLQTLVHEIRPTEGVQLIVYFSKHHHLARTKYKRHVIKRVSPCTRADGCDIYMAMDIMTMPSEYPNLREITVFSRDKFAAAVADNAPAFWGSDIWGSDIHVHHEVSL